MSPGDASSSSSGSERRFDGAELPVSAHAGDDGSPDPQLTAVLAGLKAGTSDHRSLQHALVGRRVLLPTTAVLEESEVDPDTGLVIEKSSHLGAAIFRADAGWSGMLVFTGLPAVAAWADDARPIPVTADEAAAAALDEGCDALVLDFAGPVRAVLTGSLLRALAQSRVSVPAAQDPDVLEVIAAAAESATGVASVEVRSPFEVPGALDDLADGALAPDAVVQVSPETGADPYAAAAALAEVLGAEPVLRDRLDGGLIFMLAPVADGLA